MGGWSFPNCRAGLQLTLPGVGAHAHKLEQQEQQHSRGTVGEPVSCTQSCPLEGAGHRLDEPAMTLAAPLETKEDFLRFSVGRGPVYLFLCWAVKDTDVASE